MKKKLSGGGVWLRVRYDLVNRKSLADAADCWILFGGDSMRIESHMQISHGQRDDSMPAFSG